MLKKLLFIASLFIWIFSYSFAWDALDDVLWSYSEASQYQIITDQNEVKNLVKSSKWILWSKDHKPLIVRLAQFLLKVTVMLWIIVFLIWWIRFLLSMGDDSKAKKVRDNLLIAALGFIMAFFAWVILQLILSIWPTLNW